MSEDQQFEQYHFLPVKQNAVLDSNCAQKVLRRSLPTADCRNGAWTEGKCVSLEQLVSNLNELVDSQACTCGEYWGENFDYCRVHNCGHENHYCCSHYHAPVPPGYEPPSPMSCDCSSDLQFKDDFCENPSCPKDPCENNHGCSKSDHFCPDGNLGCYPTGRTGCGEELCPACVDGDGNGNQSLEGAYETQANHATDELSSYGSRFLPPRRRV